MSVTEQTCTNQNHCTTYLSCHDWTNGWQNILRNSSLYIPQKDRQPSSAIPIPGRNETLISLTDKTYIAKNKSLTVLKDNSEETGFLDYGCSSRSLKQLGCFGTYKFPLVSLSCVLFPLESPDHSIWLNPLDIVEVSEQAGFSYITMAHGPGIVTSLRKRSIQKNAENALLILAVHRKNHSWNTSDLSIPMDYLSLSPSPFTHTIVKRPLLRRFPIPEQTLSKTLSKERMIAHFLKLDRYIAFDQLNYQTLAEMLADF